METPELSGPFLHDVTMELVFPESPEACEGVRVLWREYEALLTDTGCALGLEEELAELPGPYVRPGGRLFLARARREVVGAVGLRRHDATSSELRRLFVRPSFRRTGFGRALVVSAIGEARRAGYRRVVLHTGAGMQEAQALYRSLGFAPCEPYAEAPAGALFLELSL